MTRTVSSYSARSSWVYGALRGLILVVVGGKWAQVLSTPPDRKVVGAGPVDSRHGSYQCVWYGGDQCWWSTGRMVSVGSQGHATNGWW